MESTIDIAEGYNTSIYLLQNNAGTVCDASVEKVQELHRDQLYLHVVDILPPDMIKICQLFFTFKYDAEMKHTLYQMFTSL